MVQGLMLGRQLLSPLQINLAEQLLTSMSVGHKGKVWNCAYSIAYLNRDIVILLEFYFYKDYLGPFGNRLSLNMRENKGFW